MNTVAVHAVELGSVIMKYEVGATHSALLCQIFCPSMGSEGDALLSRFVRIISFTYKSRNHFFDDVFDGLDSLDQSAYLACTGWKQIEVPFSPCLAGVHHVIFLVEVST